jgi:putative hemolysin
MRRELLRTDGGLKVRIATTQAEVEAAQRLRHRIFYQEMGATPTDEVVRLGRDIDRFDAHCDHLLVIDPGRADAPVVGTYRMLRRSVAERCGGFYSEDEYRLDPLLARSGEVLEVGRSCVDLDYRNRAVLQLLWQGIANYVRRHQIGLLFGCASLPGTNPGQMKRPLAFLHHNFLAPKHLRPRAVQKRHVRLDVLPADRIDAAAAWRELPPLIRGYLRVGGRIGDGAVIDPQFNTTDVCIVLEISDVTQKYLRHYQPVGEGRGDRPQL